MITLNQLIILYKDIAARHEMVNDFEVAQDFNIGADDDINYPILVVNPTGANLPRTEGGYTSFRTTFELQVLDLVNKDDDNRLDVLSDTQQIINDVVNEFNTHPYYIDSGIDTIGDISFAPLRGVYNDDVDGWKITIELEYPNKLSFCGNPIENLSGFDFTPAAVTVIDGLNQYELFPSQTYECTSGEPTVVNVSNSNDSYSVNTITDLELPNINFTDTSGVTISVPSMEDLVCTGFNDWLEIEIDTTIAGATPSDSIRLGFLTDSYMCVDWESNGDIEYFNTVGLTTYDHTYNTGGVYTMRIKGFGGIYMDFTADKLKFTELKNCGAFKFIGGNSFRGCSNMVISATDVLQTEGTLQDMFMNCTLLTTPPFIKLNGNSAPSIFRNTSLNTDLGYMDLRNVVNLTSFAAGVTTWSQENYEATWEGWLRWDNVVGAPASGWILNSFASFNGGTSTVRTGTDGAAARSYAINTLGWSVIDGGEV